MPGRHLETIRVASGVPTARLLLFPGNQPATVRPACPLRGWTWRFSGGVTGDRDKNWLGYFPLGCYLTVGTYTATSFWEPPSLVLLLVGRIVHGIPQVRTFHAPPSWSDYFRAEAEDSWLNSRCCCSAVEGQQQEADHTMPLMAQGTKQNTRHILGAPKISSGALQKSQGQRSSKMAFSRGVSVLSLEVSLRERATRTEAETTYGVSGTSSDKNTTRQGTGVGVKKY